MIVVHCWNITTCRDAVGLVSRYARRAYEGLANRDAWMKARNLPCNASIWMVPGTYAEGE